MVTATLDDHSITLEGHAGHSENGQDIVCSAISALTCNFINSLKQIAHEKIYYEIENGFTMISWEIPMSETGKTLLKSFVLGLEAINQEYNCIMFN